MNLFRTARRLLAVRIRDRRELDRYVVRITVLCTAAALTFDILNQLWFFDSWSSAFRSWGITVAIALMIVVPVTRSIAKAHLALYRATRMDSLTGLLNRRALLDGFDRQPAVMALVIVDLDRFKQVNDTHGHLVGDDVLRTVARMMEASLGECGALGRLGGEEFALLATTAQRDTLVRRLERFRELMASTALPAGPTTVSTTISAGLAFRCKQQSFEQLYARADRALYVAKTTGRNRIVVADDLDAAPIPLPSGSDGRTDRRSNTG